MHTDPASTARGPLAFVPVVLGLVALLTSGAYQAQRFGVFIQSCYSLDRFIQRHLDAIGIFSSITALLGVVAGLVLLRLQGQSLPLKWGTILSVVVLLWTALGLSL